MKAGTGAGGQHVGGAAGAGGDKNGAGNNKAGGEDGGGSNGGGGTDTGTDTSAGNAATSLEPPNRQQANNGSGGETQHQQQPAAAQKPPLPPTMTSAAKGGGGGGEQQQQTHHQQHQDETKEKKLQVGSDSGDPDDPEEDEILEESPCKRWSKRREKVKQRDVPGIDAAYLAMDNETGNEVVWNEVLFSERKNFREQEEKIRAVFDHLTRLEHPYLVKFHKYWLDTKSEKPRIIFITEYMSSGPMSRFLQKARSSGTLLNIKAWKNWIRQILSALSYLHSCDPPIVHGNLTCNTMFIQHNGLVKIGCVAPNTIHHHVKTYRENIKNIHYLAPEYDHLTEITTQADIYSFGVCALEMATTGALQSGSLNGGSAGASTAGPLEKASSAPPAIESGGSSSTATAQTLVAGGSHIVTEELLRKAVDSLEDPEQKEFINRCLEKDPNIRANAAELLSRLGPAEPEKDEINLDEEAFMDEIRQQTHEPTPTPGMAADRATSPPQQQETAPNIEAAGTTSSNTSTIHHHHQAPQQQQHNQAAAALLNQNTQQQQPLLQTVTTTTATQQDGYHTQCTVTTTIATHASAAATTTTTANAHPQTSSTLLPSTAQQQNIQQQNNSQQQQQHMQLLHQTAPDEGYHTTQSIVDAPTGTSTPLSAEMSILPTSGMPAQHRETRQILQMQAEMLDSRQLRVQLQLDDQMNRQLTALLRDEDTPEALVAELVQHGFVSEANSPKMRELLATVLSEHRRRELEQAARREFGDSGQHRQSAAASSTASSNHSSAHQSPKHQSVPPPQTSSTS